LIPKAGRPEFFLEETESTSGPRDIGRFRDWTERAVAYLDLAVAQHHGLATRLLDWTLNPLVAVFFACCDRPDADGCVYFYYPPDPFVNRDRTPLDANLAGIAYIPRALSPRILSQRGAFTVHGPPTKLIVPQPHEFLPDTMTLVRLDIPANLKWDVLVHLHDYGINRAMVFPDIDGLSASVNFETQTMVRRHNRRAMGEGGRTDDPT
jgi:hypothetical protein